MMKKHLTLWIVLMGACFFSSSGLNALMIEAIQNDLPYTVRIEFSKIDDEDVLVSLDIAPGATVPFGQVCPFQSLDSEFDDFENLSTTLSIAPASHPLCKGFIAEGIFTGLKVPATFYYQEGSPTPRCYILWNSLGSLSIRKNSRNIYATLRFYETDCVSKKKGTRKRMFCELVKCKFKTIDGGFSSSIDEMAE